MSGCVTFCRNQLHRAVAKYVVVTVKDLRGPLFDRSQQLLLYGGHA